MCGWAVYSWASAIALSLAGCASAPEDGADCALGGALYFGSADAGVLALSPPELRAIGVVEAVQPAEADSVLCTATLISPAYALTAAHCAQSGGIAFRGAGSARAETVVPLRHPDLDAMLFEVDAGALFEGAAPSPIRPDRGGIDSDWVGRQVTLAGVGLTEGGESGELRFVRERVIEVTEREIWVDGMGQTGACGGDSGGPLIALDANGQPRVVAILERGSADCLGLDVYLRVDALADWIGQTTGEPESHPDPATGNGC